MYSHRAFVYCYVDEAREDSGFLEKDYIALSEQAADKEIDYNVNVSRNYDVMHLFIWYVLY